MIIKSKFDGYLRGVRLYPFKDTPSPPPAPDPNVVSAAQTASNEQTARTNAKLNRVNQYTPYGNLTYSQTAPGGFDQAGYDKAMAEYNAKKAAGGGGSAGVTTTNPVTGESYTEGGTAGAGDIGAPPSRDQFTTPGSDEWNATITLSPEQQKLLESDNRIKAALGNIAETGLSRVGQSMGTPFDTSKMTDYRDVPQGGGFTADGKAQAFQAPDLNYKTGVDGKPIQMALPNSDYAAQRSNVEDAIYSRLNPQLQRDRNQLEQRLANQGIMPGSEAYNNAIDEADRQANDARMQAVLAGGQEQSRLAGLDLQAGQFANQAQQQDFGQGFANAGLNNSVQDTTFNQALQGQAFNNQAQQQNFAQGLAANQQNFQQGLAASQAAEAQRQQQMQEEAYMRSLPLNELNALRTGAQVTNPQFSAQPQTNVAGTDVAGNVWRNYQGQQQNYSNQVAANNSFTNGLFGLGAAWLGA